MNALNIPDIADSLASLVPDRADTRLRLDHLEPMFKSYVEQWLWYLSAQNRAARTLNTYAESLRLFGQFLMRRDFPTDPQLVRPSHVQGFMNELLHTLDARTGQKRYKPATAANRFRALQQFFRWLVEIQGEVEVSPMQKLRPPAVDVEAPPVLDPQQLRALLATCGKRREARDARDYAILLVLIDSGMRLAECTNIQVPDFDAQTGTVAIMGKGRRERHIQLGVTATNAVLAYLRRHRSVHPLARLTTALWLGPKGPLTESGIYQMVKDRGVAAGLGSINPHRFRHTSSHQGKLLGMSEEDLMIKHGWSTTAMLQRYGRSAAEERSREAQRRLSLADRL